MADTSRRQKKARHNIDISTGVSEQRLGWRANIVLWLAIFTLFLLLYFFELPYWVILLILPVMILSFVGWIAFGLIFKRGVLTWMRLASKPARLMAQGDAIAAEQACTEALERARQFRPHDHRRGIMLCELAMFVKLQGRMAEALALYEEGVSIFAKDVAKQPLDYFIGLNNYGICFIHLKDFDAAQRMLEKAVDMILTTRKREAGRSVLIALKQVQALEFVLHLNLAFLFMEMREMHEAELQLRDADTLAPLLSKKFMGQFHDHYVAMCATWELQNGNLVQAEKELKQATNPEFPSCLRVNARLHLARQEFVQAEELLRKYQAAEKKKGTLHRPDLLKSALDFAESLYGQAKHEKALAAFQEARSTAADFAVPADAEWGATLEIWRKRAEGLSRVELAKALEKEIAQIAAMPSKAITILQKFQVHPVRSQPE